MDNFKVIYHILKFLEESMDEDYIDVDKISYGNLGISENRWIKILKILEDNGYVEGIYVRISVDGEACYSINNPSITLKGLEYLEENSMMRKVCKTLKEIKSIVPGI